MEHLSFYANYIFVRHERDRITLKTASSVFLPGKLEDRSVWEAQKFHFGFDYEVTPELAFGLSAQAPITGSQVYRTTTLMGTIRFTFA